MAKAHKLKEAKAVRVITEALLKHAQRGELCVHQLKEENVAISTQRGERSDINFIESVAITQRGERSDNSKRRVYTEHRHP